MTNQNQAPLIACRLTPEVPAGIATIAIRGNSVEEFVMGLLKLRTQVLEFRKIYYGSIQLESDSARESQTSENAMLGEEQVVVCRTNEDEIELHCHGGAAVCSAILAKLQQENCKVVSASGWLDGTKGLIERESRKLLLTASTDCVAHLLLCQKNGALTYALKKIEESLQSTATDANTGKEALANLELLLSWSTVGRYLSKPPQVVFAGPPNVGKSSLINRLVGQERSIVHPAPGTTRDWIESPVVLEGWPVLLTDTAGLRETADEIESEGVRRSHAKVQDADLVVLVVDAKQGWQAEHLDLVNSELCLIAWNKCDQLQDRKLSDPTASQLLSSGKLLTTSATSSDGVDQLGKAIANALYVLPNESLQTPYGPAIPFLESHLPDLKELQELVKAGNWTLAKSKLQSMQS